MPYLITSSENRRKMYTTVSSLIFRFSLPIRNSAPSNLLLQPLHFATPLLPTYFFNHFTSQLRNLPPLLILFSITGCKCLPSDILFDIANVPSSRLVMWSLLLSLSQNILVLVIGWWALTVCQLFKSRF